MFAGLFWCGPAFGQAAAPETAVETDPDFAEAQRHLEVLRRGTHAAREEALGALTRMGRRAREALLDALSDPDPDLRFHALILLHEPDGRLERLVTEVVEGQAVNAASYPAALEAYREVLRDATPETRQLLVTSVRAHVQSGKPYATVCLELLGDLFVRDLPGGSVGAEDATRLAGLLELDLRHAFHELIVAFARLPYELAEPALRARMSGGRPEVRARAARVLAELAPPGRVEGAGRTVASLLRDRNPIVRRQALISLDLLDLPARSLEPVAAACRDADADVAQEALRIAGERRIAEALDAALRIAAQAEAPIGLRLEAVRTLGLIGRQRATPVLLPLARHSDDRELRVLAAWALGAVQAPDAVATLRAMIADTAFSQERPLFFGLARAGAPGVAALTDLLAAGPETPTRSRHGFTFSRGERRANALQALGRVRGNPRVLAALETILIPDEPRSPRRSSDSTETRLALEALADHDEEQARQLIARYALSPRGRMRQQLETVHTILGRQGGPADPELRQQLSDLLARFVLTTSNVNAADALGKVDREAAQAALRQLLQGQRGSSSERGRDLARSLARAGDPSAVRARALPLSRREVEGANRGARHHRMNDVGIDLLYARDYEEALLEFRRMLWCDADYDIAAYNVACAFSLMGRGDDALRYLRRCVRHGYEDPRHMAADTDLSTLRGDARFQRLLERLHLAEETAGTLPDTSWPQGSNE